MKYAPPLHRTIAARPLAFGLLVLVILPFFVTDRYTRLTLILTFLFAVVASNWDVSLGLGGIFNFAHMGFFAIGLYSYGIVTTVWDLNPWIALVTAPIGALVLAALLAAPVRRLDGNYVILVTIAASQLLLKLIISQSDYTGGTAGMVLLPDLSILGFRLDGSERIGYYYLGLALLVISTTVLYKLERSSFGRAIKALRDNKYYAISRGVREGRVRLLTLAASSVFPAIAGAFYGALLGVASPDVFGLGLLTLVLSIVLLGGAATIWGSLFAAFIIVGARQALADFTEWRIIITALIIIAVVLVYPGGIHGALLELRSGLDRLATNLVAAGRRRFGRSTRLALMGATDRLIKTTHGKISVCDTGGSGYPLLLIHGNSSSKEAFRHQFMQLRDQYRIVAFDLPGHGVSANGRPDEDYNLPAFAEGAREITEYLELGEPLVLGWSLGGYVALEYAARGYPVRALAICGTSPLGSYPEDLPRGYIATPHMELTSRRFHSRYEKASYAGHTVGLSRKAEPLLWKAVWRTDGKAREQLFARLKTVDWPRQMRLLESGSTPFAMINGPKDPFLNHAYNESIEYGAIWQGGPQYVDGCGHSPFLEDPTGFNQCLSDFFSSVLAGEAELVAPKAEQREIGA